MPRKKTKEEISYNMSQVRNSGTGIEKKMCDALITIGITTFVFNDNTVFGKPDITFPARKIAVFCDGDYWHGYNWKVKKHEIKSNKEFWYNKIEKTMQRDRLVTKTLRSQGWTVLRFWGHEIKKSSALCAQIIAKKLYTMPTVPYRTIDLCAGIGGIRRGFELTNRFVNVLSAEIDPFACKTYNHLFGENPQNDLTTEEFKKTVERTPYDFLLAGFPCQTFSRVGNEEGFKNVERGQIFFHIAEIIKRTRPIGFFLENVDNLTTHNTGKTFKTIAETLVNELGYYIIGIQKGEDGTLLYSPKNFIRNSRSFGVPQNRPRTYIIGFDTERFSQKLDRLPSSIPDKSDRILYKDLNSVLEHKVAPKYYMSSGYWNTLIRHRERQENKGYGFGYRVVNEPNIDSPVANTLLATGGSGKERNLIRDPQDGISGMVIKSKKSPLNSDGIRVMTPVEWGKLQGFINYAFLNDDGTEGFSFPEGLPDAQKYKQFGNSVTIPVIEEMANFIIRCLNAMC